MSSLPSGQNYWHLSSMNLHMFFTASYYRTLVDFSALILNRQTWLAIQTVEDFRRLFTEQMTGDRGGGARSDKFEFADARRTPRHTTNSTINTFQSLTLNDNKILYQDTEAEPSNFEFNRTAICGTHYINTEAATKRQTIFTHLNSFEEWGTLSPISISIRDTSNLIMIICFLSLPCSQLYASFDIFLYLSTTKPTQL